MTLAILSHHLSQNDMTLKEDEFWKPVITTLQILDGEDDIVCITFDAEGDWEALGNLDIDDDDLEAVSVEDIRNLDPSVDTMPDIAPGQSVIRLSKGSPWTIAEEEE